MTHITCHIVIYMKPRSNLGFISPSPNLFYTPPARFPHQNQRFFPTASKSSDLNIANYIYTSSSSSSPYTQQNYTGLKVSVRSCVITTMALPTNIATAIQDPFGHGYEGRIAVSRDFSTRRAGIAAVVRQFAARSKPAPPSSQYQYLISYGYYSAEELKGHPGCPPLKIQATEPTPAEEEEAKRAAEEERMRGENEYVAKVEKEKWEHREDRILRWRMKDADADKDHDRCDCSACEEARRSGW